MAAIGGIAGTAAAPAMLAAGPIAPAMHHQDVGRVNLFVSLMNTMGMLIVLALLLAQIMMGTYK